MHINSILFHFRFWFIDFIVLTLCSFHLCLERTIFFLFISFSLQFISFFFVLWFCVFCFHWLLFLMGHRQFLWYICPIFLVSRLTARWNLSCLDFSNCCRIQIDPFLYFIYVYFFFWNIFIFIWCFYCFCRCFYVVFGMLCACVWGFFLFLFRNHIILTSLG